MSKSYEIIAIHPVFNFASLALFSETGEIDAIDYSNSRIRAAFALDNGQPVGGYPRWHKIHGDDPEEAFIIHAGSKYYIRDFIII